MACPLLLPGPLLAWALNDICPSPPGDRSHGAHVPVMVRVSFQKALTTDSVVGGAGRQQDTYVLALPTSVDLHRCKKLYRAFRLGSRSNLSALIPGQPQIT